MARKHAPRGKLNPKQLRFVAEYLIDLNATQAAVRAGYSARCAQEIGAENLSKPLIAEAIQAGQRQQLEKTDLTAARTLEELRRLSFSDLRGAFDASGHLLPLDKMSADMRSAIASVKVTKKNLTAGDGVMEDVVELKLWDKTRALDTLAKHFRLLEPEALPPNERDRPRIVIILQAPPVGQEARILPVRVGRAGT